MQTNPSWITRSEALQDISAGTYVDVQLGPVELGDATSLFEFLPAPSDPNDLIILLFSLWEWLPASECYDGSFYPTVCYSGVGEPIDQFLNFLDLTSKDYAQILQGTTYQSTELPFASIGAGQGLSVKDGGGNVFAGGNGVVKGRVFYAIKRASTMPATQTFFTIIEVDQENQTFRVNADATDIGSTFNVVGNTGDPTNNGTYTKVSATQIGTPRTIIATNSGLGYQVAGDLTAEFPVDSIVLVADRLHAEDDGYRKVQTVEFDTDHTNIGLTYTPDFDDTSGTIMRSATDIVVSETIPDSTADGWVK